jgi:hypothetical protein
VFTLPPWLRWSTSEARSRTRPLTRSRARGRSTSSPLRLIPPPREASYAGAHTYPTIRSHATGLATDEMAGSDAASSTGP